MDGGYQGEPLVRWVMDTHRWILDKVLRPKEVRGFVLVPKRFVAATLALPLNTISDRHIPNHMGLGIQRRLPTGVPQINLNLLNLCPS